MKKSIFRFILVLGICLCELEEALSGNAPKNLFIVCYRCACFAWTTIAALRGDCDGIVSFEQIETTELDIKGAIIIWSDIKLMAFRTGHSRNYSHGNSLKRARRVNFTLQFESIG
jgi:hypothetical protein